MIGWAITFFLLAIIAGMFGFGGLAGTFASIAQLLTVVFVVLFLASLVYGVVTGRNTPSRPIA
jgi:uncharacterized membrane protein YtjA (UPF0391 family)